jgi:hypothetical protein
LRIQKLNLVSQTNKLQYRGKLGHAVAQLVEILLYKPGGGGFDF